MDDDLTLVMVIGIGQNCETSQASMRQIMQLTPEVEPNRKHLDARVAGLSPGSRRKRNKCMKCGYDRNHARCPAKDSKCNYCRKKGNFAAMCRRKASTYMVEEMCGSRNQVMTAAHI